LGIGTFLFVVGGIFWLLTYFEIIKKGFKDNYYGMPIAALLINISWEFIYSFVYPADGPQVYINYLWLALDFIIFYQLLKYWKNDFNNISPFIFYPFLFSLLIISYLLVVVLAKEFGVLMGCFYTAYANNLLMSILFISMLYKRKSLAGQSLSIAVFKLIGTLVTSIGYYHYEQHVTNSLLLKYFFASILFFDIVYVIMIYLQTKNKLFMSLKETY
jgi:hypothetical protein